MAAAVACSVEDFGKWLSLDLAKRSPGKGKHAAGPMVGQWLSITQRTGRRAARGDDFSWRLAMLCHAYVRGGASVLEASLRASDWPFVQERFGKSKRGRRANNGERVGLVEEVIRSKYIHYRRGHPNLDTLLDGALGMFAGWKDWVSAATESEVGFAESLYQQKGQIKRAKEFRALAEAIRKSCGSRDETDRYVQELKLVTSQLTVLRKAKRTCGWTQGMVTLHLRIASLEVKLGNGREARKQYKTAANLNAGDPDTSAHRKRQVEAFIKQQVDTLPPPNPPRSITSHLSPKSC